MTNGYQRVFYVSRAVLQPPELPVLLKRCRDGNSKLQVTGVLVFTGGHFAQMVEGPRQAIRDLVARIGRDPRHEAMRVLLDAPAASRVCGGWSMRLVETPFGDDLVKLLLTDSQPPADRIERLVGQLTGQA